MSPILRLLLPGLGIVLIALPLLEIALFVVIGGQIGVFATMAMVIATGLIGAMVLSRQGLQTLERIDRAIRAGQVPVRDVFDGFLMIVAALLLITPGFATDTIGFLLTVPAVRGLLADAVQRRARVHVQGMRMNGGPGGVPGSGGSAGFRQGPVIEGELVEGAPGRPGGPAEPRP